MFVWLVSTICIRHFQRRRIAINKNHTDDFSGAPSNVKWGRFRIGLVDKLPQERNRKASQQLYLVPRSDKRDDEEGSQDSRQRELFLATT
jgi:hypothetical protein